MRNRTLSPLRGAILAAFAAALAACGGPSTASRKAVNTMIASQNYAGAEQYLDRNKERQYGKKNAVLYYLDKGAVQHFAGKYKESDESLDNAERRMEELYTKSITKAAGMMVLNDTTAEYAGEPFERALTNVLRALNYVFLGKPDEALVESRKAEMFLDELNRKLEKKSVYKDDAFARYLDSLLYADVGKMDDARISMEAANEAYSWYASQYNTPAPRFDFPPAQARRDHGELVFIHYNGVAPRKVSKTFQVAWGEAMALAQASDESNQKFKNALSAGVLGKAITVAYPEYVQDPFTIVSSELKAGESAAGSTVLVEDISAIAMKTLADRNALIRARAIARAAIKFVLAEAVAKAAAKECRRIGNPLGKKACELAARAIAHGAAAATEIADTRGWSTLPSQIRMARLKLPAGKHDVEVNFKNAAGVVVGTKLFQGVEILKSKRTYLQHRTAI